MKNYLLSALIGSAIVIGCASAGTISWLENGHTMKATTPDSSLENKATSTQTQLKGNTVTLATGQEVILTGGVYVKADDTSKVLAWAATNNYIALEDPYIPGAINIDTTPEESIEISNQIGQIDGVTTAAPKYHMPVVTQ